MSRTDTATITPEPNASGCSADDCDTVELLARVDPNAEDAAARVLCPTHRVEYLRAVNI